MKLPIHLMVAGLAAACLHAQSPYASLQSPKQIQYQGRVATAAGGAWSGTEGYFTFALVQGATILWNNWDGSSNPATALTAYTNTQSANVLTLPVSQGVFSIRLGDTTLSTSANREIPATVFFNTTSNSVRTGVKLAVWFSPSGSGFTRLSPDVEFTSVPYSMVSGIAETVKERAVTTAMLATGAVGSAQLASNVTINGTFTGTGTGTFSGNGAGLTGITAASVAIPAGMALIPAGAFTMGNSVAADTDIGEAAPVSTTVSAFYMDVNEVTLSQWQAVYYWAKDNGYTDLPAGSGKGPNHPVQTVNWYTVVKWCNARSEQAGKAPVYYTNNAQTTV